MYAHRLALEPLDARAHLPGEVVVGGAQRGVVGDAQAVREDEEEARHDLVRVRGRVRVRVRGRGRGRGRVRVRVRGRGRAWVRVRVKSHLRLLPVAVAEDPAHPHHHLD